MWCIRASTRLHLPKVNIPQEVHYKQPYGRNYLEIDTTYPQFSSLTTKIYLHTHPANIELNPNKYLY